MIETVVISPAEQRFIEDLGLHFEAFGVPRIGGRMFALLLVAPRPLALEELADLLLVSRASISTNSRLFLQVGVLEHRSIPGDRRRFYAFSANAWEHRLQGVWANASELRRLVAVAQSAVAQENSPARDRLEVAGAFAAFLEGEATEMVTKWRALHVHLEEKP
jgi:DNA-binding transcriptional regulator GbsR (MarR family)